MLKIRPIALGIAAAIVCFGYLAVPSESAELLTIGSSAPSLDVEHWIQDGGGKFKPVTEFEPGKVYVVEFWATWCGPCVASMPHLAALQKEMGKKGVRIVSISDEDLETVENFLDREVRGGVPGESGDTKQTYRELTSAYSLTTDPDQSSYRDYMQAAAQNGIPTAFIVGKDAKVEWIGHPMEIDGPLEAVVEGSWDRDAYAKEIKARQEAEKMMQDIFALLQKQDFDAAIKLIDKAAQKDDSLQLKMLKLQVLLAAEKPDAALAHLNKLYEELADSPQTINMIAWNVYEMVEGGRVEDGPMVTASMDAVKAAFEKSEGEEKASVLDTLAHLHFVQGNLDEAIRVEREAVKLTGDRDREFIEGFMKELNEAKSSQSKDK